MSDSKQHKVQKHHDFEGKSSKHHKNKQKAPAPDDLDIGTSLNELYLGLAVLEVQPTEVTIGYTVHDGTYSNDFAVERLSFADDSSIEKRRSILEDHVINSITNYRKEHLCKILGAGVAVIYDDVAEKLCTRLWQDLDIVPLHVEVSSVAKDEGQIDSSPNVDELADSAVRECLSIFGPTKQPRLSINYRDEVQVDSNGRIHLALPIDYEKSVRAPTWRAVQKYITDVKDRKIRIAFFSATPQGGGVALMRHALLRFLRQQGVHVQWFVPRPRPNVFRITKTNHNILQGVVPPDVRQSDEDLNKIDEWINHNAEGYWLREHGPLRPSKDGGADVIVIDDPQMPSLIPLAKKQDSKRPVIFRSHIEVRDDLVQEDGSAAQHVWKWMWQSIKQADIFISHPVKSFVPFSDVQEKKVAWLPATTDWLDGLNKNMSEWDVEYYLHELRQMCQTQGLPQLSFPKREYIVQIARFDPAKGIPDVIKGFARYREMVKDAAAEEQLQLVIAGHSSVDDPDGTMIYDQTLDLIHKEFKHLQKDIVVIRLGPSDQMLNAIMSMAKIALQLSTREGFEVKVSEALHKGKPIITTKTGGIPLQVEDGKSGFLVERGDHEAIAKHLHALVTDKELYAKMSEYARSHVSDEVHTVGNALAWLYLASSLAGGKQFEPKAHWVNDLAREAADEPYEDGEPRLPRHLTT